MFLWMLNKRIDDRDHSIDSLIVRHCGALFNLLGEEWNVKKCCGIRLGISDTDIRGEEKKTRIERTIEKEG